MQETIPEILPVKDKLIACNGIIYIEKNNSDHIEINTQEELLILLETVDSYDIELKVDDDLDDDFARYNNDKKELFEKFLKLFLPHVIAISIDIAGGEGAFYAYEEQAICDIIKIIDDALKNCHCKAKKFTCTIDLPKDFRNNSIPIITNFNLTHLHTLKLKIQTNFQHREDISNFILKNKSLTTLNLDIVRLNVERLKKALIDINKAMIQLPQLKNLTLVLHIIDKPSCTSTIDSVTLEKIDTIFFELSIKDFHNHPTIQQLTWWGLFKQMLSRLSGDPNLCRYPTNNQRFMPETKHPVDSTIMLDLVATFGRNLHLQKTFSDRHSLKFLCYKTIVNHSKIKTKFFSKSNQLAAEIQDPLEDKGINLNLAATYIGHYLYYYNMVLPNISTQDEEKINPNALSDCVDYAKSELMQLEKNQTTDILCIEKIENSEIKYSCTINFNKEKQIIEITTYHPEKNSTKIKTFSYQDLKMAHMEKEFADTRNQQKPVNPKKRTREEENDDDEQQEPSPFNIGQVQ